MGCLAREVGPDTDRVGSLAREVGPEADCVGRLAREARFGEAPGGDAIR